MSLKLVFAIFLIGTLIAETAPKEKVVRLSSTRFCLTRTYLNTLGADLTKLLQSADATPEPTPDKMGIVGFRFTLIHPNSEILALGFRKGDLLTGFDQVSFDNVAKPLVAFQTLRRGGPTSADEEHAVKIVRHGKKMALSYQVKNSCGKN
jgi:type II secretory pathway component PulC